MNRTYTPLFLLLLLLAQPAHAQQPAREWGVGFYAVSDNREYDRAQHQLDQSQLGAWLVPEVGVAFDSVHHLRAGVGVKRYFGSDQKGVDAAEYVAYYRYHLAPFELYVGSFPARALLADYPAALLYDSITDFRLNMNGVFWHIYGRQWHADIWLDWTGRQSFEQREKFLVGIAGRCAHRGVYAAVQGYMNHFAGIMGAGNDTLNVVDNGMTRPCVGFALPTNRWMDSLNISAGMLASYTRDRGDGKVYGFRKGFYGELLLEKFGLGLKNTLYVGENQLSHYLKYSEQHLYWGDPFFQNTFYNRTDLYIQLLDTPRVQARFAWGLHVAEGILSHQQRFTLSVSLDSAKPAGPHRHRRTLAGWMRRP